MRATREAHPQTTALRMSSLPASPLLWAGTEALGEELDYVHENKGGSLVEQGAPHPALFRDGKNEPYLSGPMTFLGVSVTTAQAMPYVMQPCCISQKIWGHLE